MGEDSSGSGITRKWVTFVFSFNILRHGGHCREVHRLPAPLGGLAWPQVRSEKNFLPTASTNLGIMKQKFNCPCKKLTAVQTTQEFENHWVKAMEAGSELDHVKCNTWKVCLSFNLALKCFQTCYICPCTFPLIFTTHVNQKQRSLIRISVMQTY